MYDVQLCTYVVHARYIPVTSDLRMRNRHVEVAYTTMCCVLSSAKEYRGNFYLSPQKPLFEIVSNGH